MFVRDEEQLETIHLYVVRDDEPASPSPAPIALSLLCLCLVLAVGVLFPYRPPLVRQTIKVPALFLPLLSFTVTQVVIPTGRQFYPATYAMGMLTLSNGSVIGQALPAGMLFTASNGVEVVTTQAVYVPPSNGVSFGYTRVPARAVMAGVKGNLFPFALDVVYGTALYIKNDQSFTGGKDSYTVEVITPQDTQDALVKARASLLQYTRERLLVQPCLEQWSGGTLLRVTWRCQFVTWEPVHGKVLSWKVQGADIVLVVETIAPKQIRETK